MQLNYYVRAFTIQIKIPLPAYASQFTHIARSEVRLANYGENKFVIIFPCFQQQYMHR